MYDLAFAAIALLIGSLVVGIVVQQDPELSTADARVLSAPTVLIATPASGPAGSRVTITGTNFYRGDVQLTWDGDASAMSMVRADANGAFESSITIKTNAALGGHRVGATQPARRSRPALKASVPFTVAVTPAPNPAPVPPAPPTPPPAPAGSWWHPPLVMNWQWQLTTPVDQSLNVTAYDIDGFDNSASVVAALHAAGRRVICYMEVGAWENYRPDAASFPASILGNVMGGYPNERYVDIRDPLLRPIIEARLDICKAKGFDAVEPDIDDSYTENTGFPISRADQLAYDTWLASAAHARGLAFFLKNGPGIATSLATVMDGALTEQCFQYSECGGYSSFVNLGKPVLSVEYSLAVSAFCSQANALNFNAMRKNTSLNVYREACR
jgi:hypothetical protein